MHSQDLPNEKIQDLWGLCNWIQCCTDLLVTLGLCFCTATARNGSLAVVLHVMRTDPSIRFVGDKQYLHSLDSKVTLVLREDVAYSGLMRLRKESSNTWRRSTNAAFPVIEMVRFRCARHVDFSPFVARTPCGEMNVSLW